MNEMKHHLVLGEMTDYLTGKTVEDNHDERLRQKIARFLVERKGYGKKDVASRIELIVSAGDKKARLKIDFCVFQRGKACIAIKYGPGSLVTRRRPALAASRLLEKYQIPIVVVTNGIDAEIMDGISGKITGESLMAVPDRNALMERFEKFDFRPVSEKRAEMESRILYAYEVDDACPCDDGVCRL